MLFFSFIKGKIMKIFSRIGWFIKEEKWSYIIGITSLGIIAFLDLIPPRIMGNIIDAMISKELTKTTLLLNIGSLILIALFVYGARYLWRVYIFGTSFRLERKMRLRLFEHFTKMSPNFFQDFRTGDLMAHATNDIKAIQRVAGNGVLQFADALLTGTFVLIAMIFTISWKMTLFALLPMPIMIIGARILGKKLHKAFSESQASFSGLNNKIHESISGIKVTKTFGQENEEIKSFKEETENVYQKYMTVTKYDTLFNPLVMTVITLSYVLILIVGIILIKNGELTTGKLSTFVSYVHILIWPMMAIGFLFNTIERGNASFDRIEKLLEIEEDIVNFDKVSLDSFKGDLHFNIESFSYPDVSEAALKSIQFDLKEGQTLGIVGKTGSGKSTLIKLLLREYDDYKGSIYYDEKNIKDINLHHLRQALAYVPQDNFLFSMSILDNIRFGNPKASLEEVIETAKIAGVHDDIMEFDLGYDTMMGERGVSLSGGQRQRVSIARALLMHANILILDDSLSAVDAKTEAAILKSLKEKRQNMTNIILAHRLSALKHADLILVLDDGEIIERGNHESLIKENGWYAMIYNQQEFEKGTQDGKNA